MSSKPLISIICATYNGSHVLQYAVLSVLAQTHENWELIITGDHCTDDTESLLERFKDPRISFINLPVNSGGQAAPNNEGLARAKGEIITFINQDDLYLPWHLDIIAERFGSSNADFLLARHAIVHVREESSGRIVLEARNGGMHEYQPEYNPLRFYVASSWAFKKYVYEKIGNWVSESETIVTPSRQWIHRVYCASFIIQGTMIPSLLVLYTGERSNFYKQKIALEHHYLYQRFIQDGDDMIELQRKIEQRLDNEYAMKPLPFMRRCVIAFGSWLLILFSKWTGQHPITPIWYWRHGGKGAFIRRHSERSGIGKPNS